MNKILLVNGLITPDGTVLITHHQHDYQSYKDQNGETYIIDGGPFEYGVRISSNTIKAKHFHIYNTDDYSIIRDFFEFNVNYNNYIKIKDLSLNNIEDLLNIENLEKHLIELLHKEIKYRNINSL